MSDLTEMEIRALNEALDDEYRTWTTYGQVIADFGKMPPFSNIRQAEARHIEALCCLFATSCPCPKIPGRAFRQRAGSLRSGRGCRDCQWRNVRPAAHGDPCARASLWYCAICRRRRNSATWLRFSAVRNVRRVVVLA